MITKFKDIDVPSELESRLDELVKKNAILFSERIKYSTALSKLSDVSYKNLIRIKELLDEGKIETSRFEELKKEVFAKPTSLFPISKNGLKSYPRSPLNEAIHDVGWKVIDEMDDDDWENLSNKSGTLHFQNLLGLYALKKTKTIETGIKRKYERDAAPIGVSFISEESVEIPRIKEGILKATSKNIYIEVLQEVDSNGDFIKSGGYFKDGKLRATDFKHIFEWESVDAGEVFHLNLYEVMRFIIQDQYAGYCEANDDPRGMYFSVKGVEALKIDDRKGVKLKSDEENTEYFIFPTPTIHFLKRYGPIKDRLYYIDEETPNRKWITKLGYERFKYFIPETRRDKNVIRNKHLIFTNNSKIACLLQRDLGLTDGVVHKPAKKSRKSYIQAAQEWIEGFDRTRFEELGVNSKTLSIVQELRYFTHRSLPIPGIDTTVPVGVTLMSEIDLKVPVLPYSFEYEDGIDPHVIQYKDVKAHEEFHMTLYEFMYLLLQDEYVGVCRIQGSSDNAELDFKDFEGYLTGKCGLPQPKLEIKDRKVIKSKEIYRKLDDKIEILPEFREKFGVLLRD